MRLPVAPPPDPATDAVAPPPRVRPSEGRRIIVVDDNEDAAMLLAELLEALGNTTRVAHDAAAALRIVEEFEPEVAVLDIGLPAVDGYELARHLRARLAGSPLRLIALTGYGQAADKQRAKDAGFDAHLVKPVALDALRGLLT